MTRLFKNIFREFSFLRGSLLILVVTWMVMNFGGGMLYPYWSPYLREIGASPFIIGIIVSMGNIALFISRIPGSYITDKYGRKKIITTMTFFVAFIQLGYALFPDWRIFLFFSVLEGIALLYQPALSAMVADLIPEDRRGLGYAVVNTLPSLSSIASPIIGSIFVSMYGLGNGVRTIFIIIFILYIFSAILRHLYLEETLQTSEEIGFDFKSLFSESIRAMYDAWIESPKNLKYVVAILVISSIEDPIFLNYASLYVFDVMKVSEFEWGLAVSLLLTLSFLLSIPAGKFVDTYGRKTALILGYVMVIPAMVILLNPSVPYALWLIVILVSIPNALLNPAFNSIITDLTPKEYRGRIFGMIGNLNLIAVTASSPIAGYLYEISPAYPFLLIIFTSISILIILTFRLEETRKAKLSPH